MKPILEDDRLQEDLHKLKNYPAPDWSKPFPTNHIYAWERATKDLNDLKKYNTWLNKRLENDKLNNQ